MHSGPTNSSPRYATLPDNSGGSADIEFGEAATGTTVTVTVNATRIFAAARLIELGRGSDANGRPTCTVSEGAVLTFTHDTYNKPQTVTIDTDDDGANLAKNTMSYMSRGAHHGVL